MSALLPQLNAPQLDQSSSSAIERYVRAIAGTKMHFVSTRADLADLSDTSVPAYLTEAGCEGEFVWDSSNLSALVTADPRQGIFVASSSDTTGATGAWVRKFSHPYANSQWWGHAPGIGDVSAAKQAAVDTLYAMRGYSGVWSYGSGASIGLYTPASRYGSYNMGSTKIVVSHTMRFLGDSTGQANGGGTVEKWNDLTGGYLFTTTAPGWLLEGFTLVGGFTTTEGEYHAIEFHAAGKVRDVYGLNWSGDFLYENNTSGTNGTSNGFAVDRAYAENCRNGHNAAGSDVNAGEIRGLQTKRCRRAAVLQTGFLGTHYSYCSVTTNALTSFNTGAAGHPVSYCTQGGFRYFVIHGQEAWASANAPTGAATSNQGWGYWTVGGVGTGIPAWFAGIECRSGGAYIVSGLNNLSSFHACYSEDNNVSQFDKQVVLVQPFMAYAFLVTGGILYGQAAQFSQARLVTTSDQESVMHGLRVSKGVGAALNILSVHNDQVLAVGVAARLGFAFGYEADGVTPCYVGSVYGTSSTNNPATNTGSITWTVRTVGGAGAQTDILTLDGPNAALKPVTTNTIDLGLTGQRFKNLWLAGNATIAGAATAASVAIGGGTVLTNAVVYTPSLTPASVAASTVAEQTFTVTGLATTDKVIVNPPAIANATGIAGARVSAANTLAIRFVNPTAGALTPTSGTYTILAFRS